LIISLTWTHSVVSAQVSEPGPGLPMSGSVLERITSAVADLKDAFLVVHRSLRLGEVALA
jgi:hypothetical protein